MRGHKPLCVVPGLLAIIFLAGCSQTPQQKYARFMEAGRKQMESHDYHRAILNFQSAVKAQPQEPEAYYRLALAYLNTTRPKEAIIALRQATEANPAYSPAQLKLAELMIRTHNEQLVRDAEARVQKILTGNPSDNDALFMLAATQAQLGNPEDAEKHLNDVLKNAPGHLKSAIALARLKISQKDFKGAEEVLKNAVERSPNSSAAAVALGILYAGTAKTAAAEALLQKATQLDNNNTAVALTALGALQLQAGKKAEAEQTYKELSTLPQKDHKLAYAVFLMRQNRQQDAVTELERLVKADGNDRIARSGLVAGYLATNQPAKAEAILNSVLKVNPRDIEALTQRCQIYLQQNRHDLAQRDIEEVLRHDPSSSQGHYLISRVYGARGELHRQKHELTEALRLAPDSLRVRLDLANALLISNNPKAALQILNGAQERQQRTLAFVIARNWVLIALGEEAQARRNVDAVLAVSRIPDVLLQDAILKLAAQNFAGARAALEEVLKANPEDLRALALLVRTYVAQKQPGLADEKIRSYAAANPKSARLQVFLAQWLLENNKETEARQALE
ncbi:MAG TPA: tetratricopeptide repeat protein, partial [Terriglobales bacterium]